jgi:hypothetical protein
MNNMDETMESFFRRERREGLDEEALLLESFSIFLATPPKMSVEFNLKFSILLFIL